jgi:disulfide bond formation protein DsbB
VLELKPCPLCLEQRVPYYIAIPLALFVAFAASRRAPRTFLVVGLAAVALVMLWSAGLGVYHAGIEWGVWSGPQDCSGAVEFGPASDFMKRLEHTNIVRCDEAAWRFLGLSLAGWNALISAALAAVALSGIAAERTLGLK